MLLDYVTLLTAVGVSAGCLSVMIFIGWLMGPKDSFLLNCSAGGALCGLGLLLYGFYVATPKVPIAVAAFCIIMVGLSLLVGAGYRFRTDRPSRRLVTMLAIGAIVVAIPPLALGYTGIGFVPVNLTVGLLLAMTAGQYWGARRHAPVAITGLCSLYCLMALTFILCAAMLSLDGRLTLPGAPAGWAEDLALLVMIACIPGIGAVTLALSQNRTAREHQRAAMTDSLTGLMNRRALFKERGGSPVAAGTAIIVFDIDHFKCINDNHGHAVGDQVIILFARAIECEVPKDTLAARLGGEEFALVVPLSSADRAFRLAENVCRHFAQMSTSIGIAGFSSTASAGIAFGVVHGESFEQVLNEADKALYAAKRGGRNRVTPAEPRLYG